MNKMSIPSRIVIAIASLSLISVYFLPVWFIYLLAPQYPEGLTMNIWLSKLTGQVDIINGLNHYIGMKHISVDMFPEFSYLVYILAFFILFGLLTAALGKTKVLYTFLGILVLGGIAAMYDYYTWAYDYGHNLDPKAAIQIPGMAYQPPLLGHKTLLNFDAYSYPDTGGWVVIVAALIVFATCIVEWRRRRRKTPTLVNKTMGVAMAFGMLALSLSACNSGPQAFDYGKDVCADCKMTIMDPKFGAEIITNKGRVYKFDDVHCAKNFLNKGNVKAEALGKILFINYEKENDFVDATNAYFVVSPQLKSPMNSNAAAFADKNAAEKKAAATNGELVQWAQLKQ